MDGAVDFSAPLIVTHYNDTFERLEAQITELWGHLNAATYKLLVLIAKFDRERAYERHNLTNTAQRLNWQCGIGGVAARETVRAARARESAADQRCVRKRRDLVFQSPGDDPRRDTSE